MPIACTVTTGYCTAVQMQTRKNYTTCSFPYVNALQAAWPFDI